MQKYCALTQISLMKIKTQKVYRMIFRHDEHGRSNLGTTEIMFKQDGQANSFEHWYLFDFNLQTRAQDASQKDL